MGNFDKLADGARNAAKALGVMGLLAGPAAAQEQTNEGTIHLAAMVEDTSLQVRDCRAERRDLISTLRSQGVEGDDLREKAQQATSVCRGENTATYEAQSEAAQIELARLDVEFAEMRTWLQARGLDVNEAGHITDPEGRVLAVIEAETAELRDSTAELRDSTAALRANTQATQLRIDTLDAEYRQILEDFGRFLSSNA